MTSAGKYAGPQDVPEKLQRNVRAFLLANPKGALLAKFCGEYRRLVKESLPWKSLGYSSAAELLGAMPTAARLHYSQKDGDYRVYPVADSNTYLPSWQKKFEEKNLPRLSVPTPSPGLTNPDMIKLSMTSSASLSPRKQTRRPPTPACPSSICSQKRRREGKGGRGGGRERETRLFALHICFRHAPGVVIDCTKVTANMMRKKLPEVMKDSGTPLKIYIGEKGYAFVRFLTLAEALKAIELHHGTYVGKTWITVCPAKESRDMFPVAVVDGNSSVSNPTGGKSEEGVIEWEEEGGTHAASDSTGTGNSRVCEQWKYQAGDVRHLAKNGSLVCSKQPSQMQHISHTSSTGGGSTSAVQRDKSSYRWTGGTVCPDSSKRSIYNGSQTAAINGPVFCDEAISQGGSLSSDGSWDEELLVSSPFSSVTEQGLHTTTAASVRRVRTSNLSEWNLATPELSPHSTPNSDGLIPVRVSRVESPSLVWVQLTSDPESDVASLSQVITRLEPPRLTEVSEGSICCARLVAKGFRRIKVLQFDNYVAQQQVSVLQIDTGCSLTLPCTQLHSLPPSLSLSAVPPLAMPCRLVGISSTFGGDKWYFYDNQLLWRLIMEKEVYVKKVPRPRSSRPPSPDVPQVTVEMYLDASGEKNVATVLISQGMHIMFSEEEEEEEEEERVEDVKKAASLWRVNISEMQPSIQSTTLSLREFEESFCPLQTIPSPSPSPPPLVCSPSPPHSSPSPPPLIHSPSPPHSSPSPLHTSPSDKPRSPSSAKSPFLRLQQLLNSLPPDTAS